MRKILGTGVIGLGGIAEDHIKAILKSEKARLVAICSRDENKVKKTAKLYKVEAWHTDWREMVQRDDIDFIIICTPTYLHPEMAITAFESDKHVLTEKPIALDLRDADRMIEASKKANRKFMVGHNARYVETHLKVKELMEKKALGRIVSVWHTTASIYTTGNRPWVLDRLQGGGPFLEQTVHRIDLIRWWVGDVSSVYACGSFSPVSLTDFEGDYDYEAYKKSINPVLNNYIATLTFENGAIGQICSSHTSYIGGREIFLVGTKGTIKIEGTQKYRFPIPVMSLKTCEMDSKSIPKKLMEVDDYYTMRAKAIEREVDDFIECIIKNTEPPISGEDSRATLEIVCAIWQSVETGDVVKLPLTQ